MEKVSTIVGQMAPLARANVDTDQIMPKQFLKRVERSGFGPYLFYDWAFDEEGEPRADFITNRPEYRNATVLITGPNFGCGSSREHAPWGIEDRGFRAVIAPSFADIFYNNCINIGLLPVTLTGPEVDVLMAIAEDPANSVTIDLGAQSVTSNGFSASFEIAPAAKHRLVHGLDHIELTMEHASSIEAFEAARPSSKPTLG